jgi:hypothetical protein
MLHVSSILAYLQKQDENIKFRFFQKYHLTFNPIPFKVTNNTLCDTRFKAQKQTIHILFYLTLDCGRKIGKIILNKYKEEQL